MASKYPTVPIPHGDKLLENVATTGRQLVDDARLIGRFGSSLPVEDAILILEAHGRLGDAMVRAAERCRKEMARS